MTLDIIIPHYTEPWETGEKYFRMLAMQRGADFSQVRVTLVHDGEEHAFPDGLPLELPCAFRQMSIPHGGVSAARNAGLLAADAEWVMFCDFDDTFAHVYALRDILNVLPAPDYDMLWAEFYSEDRMKDGSMNLHLRGQNAVFIHGKLYRRSFLVDNGIFFPEDLAFNEDSAFNAILNTVIDFHRVGKLNVKTPPYVWCFTENSLTTTPGNRGKALVGLYERNKKVCEAFKKRLPFDRYCAMVARTVVDAYYALNVNSMTPELEAMRRDFKAWYRRHRPLVAFVDPDVMRQIEAISKAEHTRGDQEEEERWAVEHVAHTNEQIPIGDWLNALEKEGES